MHMQAACDLPTRAKPPTQQLPYCHPSCAPLTYNAHQCIPPPTSPRFAHLAPYLVPRLVVEVPAGDGVSGGVDAFNEGAHHVVLHAFGRLPQVAGRRLVHIAALVKPPLPKLACRHRAAGGGGSGTDAPRQRGVSWEAVQPVVGGGSAGCAAGQCSSDDDQRDHWHPPCSCRQYSMPVLMSGQAPVIPPPPTHSNKPGV